MSIAKVMIVDDSPFSRAILAEALKESDCEVVGEADSIETLLTTYKECQPDIVTMDIAMPGADGFECSRAILLHNPSAKIILVSSMKDEGTESEARRIGISGYVQKPVENEHLIEVIKNVLAPDVLYEKLISLGLDTFKESLAQNITRITKTTPVIEEKKSPNNKKTQEITIVIGIIGVYSGTVMMNLSLKSADKMAELIFKRQAKNQNEIVHMVAEFANVVGGISCSMLNNKEKKLGLRVAPPSIFLAGESAEIVSPTIELKNIIAKTDFGDIELSVGFKKESTYLWM